MSPMPRMSVRSCPRPALRKPSSKVGPVPRRHFPSDRNEFQRLPRTKTDENHPGYNLTRTAVRCQSRRSGHRQNRQRIDQLHPRGRQSARRKASHGNCGAFSRTDRKRRRNGACVSCPRDAPQAVTPRRRSAVSKQRYGTGMCPPPCERLRHSTRETRSEAAPTTCHPNEGFAEGVPLVDSVWVVAAVGLCALGRRGNAPSGSPLTEAAT